MSYESDAEVECDTCGGTGTVLGYTRHNPEPWEDGEMVPCPDCNGTGVTYIAPSEQDGGVR